MRKRTVQPEIRSFVSVLRSLITPFDRGKTIFALLAPGALPAVGVLVALESLELHL